MKSIYNNAFAYAKIDDDLVFDNTINFIERFAFYGCELKKVNFTNGAKLLKTYAFAGAKMIKFDLSQVSDIEDVILGDAIIDSLYLGNNVTVYNKSYTDPHSIGTPKSVRYLNIGKKFENLNNVFSSTTGIETVVCHNPTPPTGASFSDAVYQNATLLVPEGSIDLYRYSDGWKNFYTIKASGVNDVVRDADSWSGDDSYYDLQGRKVANPQKGIYIHHGQKVIVK